MALYLVVSTDQVAIDFGLGRILTFRTGAIIDADPALPSVVSLIRAKPPKIIPYTPSENFVQDSDSVVKQLRLSETQIQFKPDTYAGAAGSPGSVDVKIFVTDDSGVQSLFADQAVTGLPAVTQVTVDITGGTATSKTLSAGGQTSPVDGSLVVTLVGGEATVSARGTGAGTVTLGLTDSGGSGLDVSDTATVTFS